MSGPIDPAAVLAAGYGTAAEVRQHPRSTAEVVRDLCNALDAASERVRKAEAQRDALAAALDVIPTRHDVDPDANGYCIHCGVHESSDDFPGHRTSAAVLDELEAE